MPEREAIVVWSTSTGMDARLFNTRAAMGWDVPFVGHPSMSSGEIGRLVEKPSNWEKVYAIGYRSCSYDDSGKLPPRNQELVEKLKGKVDLSDTLLWWVAGGIDAVNLVAKAVENGSVVERGHRQVSGTASRNIRAISATTRFTPTEHNGYPTEDVVMSAASTAKDGSFKLAPGYK